MGTAAGTAISGDVEVSQAHHDQMLSRLAWESRQLQRWLS
jgi:hypothetical protein